MPADVAFGSHSRRLPAVGKSALPPRATKLRTRRDVRLVPIATIRAAANSSLFDHFVGESQQCRRDRKPERLCGLHVDHQLKPGRLLDRQISRFGALQYFVDVGSGKPSELDEAWRVAHETAGDH